MNPEGVEWPFADRDTSLIRRSRSCCRITFTPSHAAIATPANVADGAVLPNLLLGKETRVWGDQAYRGHTAVIRRQAPRAQDVVNGARQTG
jgi:hypothetical protein